MGTTPFLSWNGPKGETVNDWSEILTLTIQHMPNLDPVDFF